MKKVLNFLGWCLTIFLQGLCGYLLGCLLNGNLSFPPMGLFPLPLSWWVGISLGIFGAGVANLVMRNQFRAKDMLMRFVLTAAGALIPVIMTKLWSLIHFRPVPLSGFSGALIILLIYSNIHESILLGLIGFYLSGWKRVRGKFFVSEAKRFVE